MSKARTVEERQANIDRQALMANALADEDHPLHGLAVLQEIHGVLDTIEERQRDWEHTDWDNQKRLYDTANGYMAKLRWLIVRRQEEQHTHGLDD